MLQAVITLVFLFYQNVFLICFSLVMPASYENVRHKVGSRHHVVHSFHACAAKQAQAAVDGKLINELIGKMQLQFLKDPNMMESKVVTNKTLYR